jgi:hypothetical protein
VGGTGRDDAYGGMGNDLMNMDDKHSSTSTTNNPLANNVPDTHPYFEDRAFGGGGRDVLIANTGGDRLIDWTGEFNSYLVPFAPYGMATVSRTVQPQLPEFLYALSASDGVDMTRSGDAFQGNPSADTIARNGEPHGELGLIRQQDEAWNDTHGPQAGNIPGGQRDVLRSASFNDGGAQGFSLISGTWANLNGRYQVSSDGSPNSEGMGLFDQSNTVIPTYFEMQVTMNAARPTGGRKANGYLIFDYQSPTDFKFAGLNISTNKVEIGHRTANQWVVDAWQNSNLRAGIDYVVFAKVDGGRLTISVGTGNGGGNNTTVSHTFAPRVDEHGFLHYINEGIVGVASTDGSAIQIDDLVVQAPPGAITLDRTVTFAATSPATLLFSAPTSGTWTTSNGRFVANASAAAPAINFMTIGDHPVTPGSMLSIKSVLRTSGEGGVIFDYHNPNYYKFATLSDSSDQVIIGHVIGGVRTVDATFNTNVNPNNDTTFEVVLRGGQVNVLRNGALVASKLFNAPVTEGRFGLVSYMGASSGQTSFDSVQVKTDEGAYAELLRAESGQGDATGLKPLTSAQLSAALAEAARRWKAAGADASLVDAARQIRIQTADLAGDTLAAIYNSTIFVDTNAAGHGWFVDTSITNDREFTQDGDLLRALKGPAAGRIDLLSVVAHELGHALGLEHAEEGLMHETLAPGIRSTPEQHAHSFMVGVDTHGIGLMSLDSHDHEFVGTLDASDALPESFSPVGENTLGDYRALRLSETRFHSLGLSTTSRADAATIRRASGWTSRAVYQPALSLPWMSGTGQVNFTGPSIQSDML